MLYVGGKTKKSLTLVNRIPRVWLIRHPPKKMVNRLSGWSESPGKHTHNLSSQKNHQMYGRKNAWETLRKFLHDIFLRNKRAKNGDFFRGETQTQNPSRTVRGWGRLHHPQNPREVSDLEERKRDLDQWMRNPPMKTKLWTWDFLQLGVDRVSRVAHLQKKISPLKPFHLPVKKSLKKTSNHHQSIRPDQITLGLHKAAMTQRWESATARV